MANIKKIKDCVPIILILDYLDRVKFRKETHEI